MGANRKVLMTEIVGSERWSLMCQQFGWCLKLAPTLETIKVVHTDHSAKMNDLLVRMWVETVKVMKKDDPNFDEEKIFVPGMML